MMITNVNGFDIYLINMTLLLCKKLKVQLKRFSVIKEPKILIGNNLKIFAIPNRDKAHTVQLNLH